MTEETREFCPCGFEPMNGHQLEQHMYHCKQSPMYHQRWMPEETRELDVAAIRERLTCDCGYEGRAWNQFAKHHRDCKALDADAMTMRALLARITALEQERDELQTELFNVRDQLLDHQLNDGWWRE